MSDEELQKQMAVLRRVVVGRANVLESFLPNVKSNMGFIANEDDSHDDKLHYPDAIYMYLEEPEKQTSEKIQVELEQLILTLGGKGISMVYQPLPFPVVFDAPKTSLLNNKKMVQSGTAYLIQKSQPKQNAFDIQRKVVAKIKIGYITPKIIVDESLNEYRPNIIKEIEQIFIEGAKIFLNFIYQELQHCSKYEVFGPGQQVQLTAKAMDKTQRHSNGNNTIICETINNTFMEQEKYNSKYHIQCEPGSYPTFITDAKFDISGDFYATTARDLKDGKKDVELSEYFKTKEFRDGVTKITVWIKKNPDKNWAHVYYFLRQHGLKKMSKTRFGGLINDNGGPSAKTVYSSGNYSLSVDQQKNAKSLFEWVKPFFPNIDKKQ